MNDNIYWILELSIKPDEFEAFESLMHEMVASALAEEPDTLNYEWYLAAGKTQCVIHERFRNAEGVLTHLATFGDEFAERFFAAVDPVRMTVFGEVTSDIRAVLDGLGATYKKPWGGFVR